jgi:hypothetical protein
MLVYRKRRWASNPCVFAPEGHHSAERSAINRLMALPHPKQPQASSLQQVMGRIGLKKA